MKKNSFVEGTILASISLLIIKILGGIYVIPFYSIVGALGGALYSYAYTIYSLVINICTAGIPLAISKIVSEYTTLEMYDAKERTLKVGNRIVIILSTILFLLMFIFASQAAYIFVGDVSGGNSIESVTLVIRSISFCLLIVPLLAIKKGYLQGQKFISVSTNSQLIEQIVRIAFILVGSYISIKVYHLSEDIGVAIAVFGAFIAGLVAYIYLGIKIRKNKKEITYPAKGQVDKVSNKSIFKKIIKYSIPLIVVSVVVDLYNMTDLSLIIRGLSYLGYDGKTAEIIGSVMATWASKICLIVNAISIGLSISLIPYMVSNLVKKDYKAINYQLVKAIGIMLVIGIPMSVGISLLSDQIYYVFYGYSEYGGIILKMLPFSILITNIFLVINMTLQGLNKFKTVYLSSIVGLLINIVLDIPLMVLCSKIGIYPYYGAIFATMIGGGTSILIALRSLKKSMDFSYRGFVNILLKMIVPLLCMVAVVMIILYFIKDLFVSRLGMIVPCLACALFGSIIYGFIAYKNNLLYDVFGQDYVDNLLYKLKLKKKK